MHQQVIGLRGEPCFDVVRRAVFNRISAKLPDLRAWVAYPPPGWTADGGALSGVPVEYQLDARRAWGTQQLWKKLVSDISCRHLFSPATSVRMSHCRPCGFITTRKRTFTCDHAKLCPFCYGRRLMRIAASMEERASLGLWYSFVADKSPQEITRYSQLVRRTLRPRLVDSYRFFRQSSSGWVIAQFALASGNTRPPALEDAPPWTRVPRNRDAIDRLLAKACGYPWQILIPGRSEEVIPLFKMSRKLRDGLSYRAVGPEGILVPSDLTAGGFINETMCTDGGHPPSRGDVDVETGDPV